MNRENIRMEFEEQASELCMTFNAYASNIPESVIDWMTDRFIEDYEDEDAERTPDLYDTTKYILCYMQDNL